MVKIIVLVLLMGFFGCRDKKENLSDEYYKKFRSDMYTESQDSVKKLAIYIFKNHYDSSKRIEAEDWLKQHQQLIDDRIIWSRALELKAVYLEEESCNFIKKHYLVKRISKSDDTLTKAVIQLVSEVFYSMPVKDCSIKNKRCGIYLYENESDFDLRHWFVMATQLSNRSPEVTLRP